MNSIEVEFADVLQQRFHGQPPHFGWRLPQVVNARKTVFAVLHADAPPDVFESGEGRNLPGRRFHDPAPAPDVFIRQAAWLNQMGCRYGAYVKQEVIQAAQNAGVTLVGCASLRSVPDAPPRGKRGRGWPRTFGAQTPQPGRAGLV